MSDELRVTVVATGLGAAAQAVKTPPTKVGVDNTRRSNGQVDYSAYDRPTAIRQKAAASSATATVPATDKEMEFLDIPAFLRRPADEFRTGRGGAPLRSGGRRR